MKFYFRKSQCIVIVLTTLLFSCNVLDQEPQTQLEDAYAIIDEPSSRAALTGLYDALQDDHYYGGYFVIHVDMFTEDVVNSAFLDSYKQMNSQYVPTTNEGIEWIWMQMYRAVNAANNIIMRVPDVVDASFTEEERAEVTGAAEMIRGMVYLDLLRTFGEHWDINSVYGVPVRVAPARSGEFVSRNTVAETYQRIIEDLLNAQQKLPDTGAPAYASRSTATALLARTYLYMKEYTNAIEAATEILLNSNFELMADYKDVFIYENSKESVFEINFNFQDPSIYLREFSERDEATISRDLFDAFDEEDQRRITIFNDADNANLITTLKYLNQSDPAYIIRIAEMYAIRSEAIALGIGNLDDAVADLNRLRWRAGLPSIQSADVPDVNAFVEVLLTEKRKEFYAEGHRFFDLARFQKFNEVYGIENFRSIFPIPNIEIITAKSLGVILQQNPGY